MDTKPIDPQPEKPSFLEECRRWIRKHLAKRNEQDERLFEAQEFGKQRRGETK